VVAAEDKIVVFAFLRKLTEKMYESVFFKKSVKLKKAVLSGSSFLPQCGPGSRGIQADADAGQTFLCHKSLVFYMKILFLYVIGYKIFQQKPF
jgi:hypothetical protein